MTAHKVIDQNVIADVSSSIQQDGDLSRSYISIINETEFPPSACRDRRLVSD